MAQGRGSRPGRARGRAGRDPRPRVRAEPGWGACADDGAPAAAPRSRGRQGAGCLHVPGHRHRVRQGARVPRSTTGTGDRHRGRPPAPGPVAHAVGDRDRHPAAWSTTAARRSSEAEAMAGLHPGQVVIGIAGELVKGFTTSRSQERRRPDAPITRVGARQAHRGRPARGAAARPSGRSPGRPACPTSTSASSMPRSTGATHRRLRGHQPGRASRAATCASASSTRSRRWSTWARSRRVAERLGPRAARDRGRAVRRGPLHERRAGRAGGRAVRRRRWRHDGRGARAPGRRRGHAHVRARRARLHQVARRPPRAAVRGGRGRSRSTTRTGEPVDERGEVAAIIAEDVAVWSAGIELVLEEFGKQGQLPGRIELCGGGSRLPAAGRARSRDPGFARGLPFVRPPTVVDDRRRRRSGDHGPHRPARGPAGRDAHGARVPGDRAHGAEQPLDAALKRVLRGMRV